MKRNNGIGAALVVTAAAVLLVSAASYCGGLFMEQNEHFSRLLQSASKYDRTTDTELPAYLDNVANVWDTISEGEQPFFWYIAKTGGLTWQKICAECIDLVSASSRGIAAGSVKVRQTSPCITRFRQCSLTPAAFVPDTIRRLMSTEGQTMVSTSMSTLVQQRALIDLRSLVWLVQALLMSTFLSF